jgi:enoyl-CoA hydratase
MSTYENVLFDDSHGPAVRLVVVNRPAALNALNPQTLEELNAAFTETGRDRAVRCVIVTGAGERAFVAGADIKALADLSPRAARDVANLGHKLTTTMEDLAVPIIAAVRGFALGGGCELALACDFIYAADDARFGFPEIKIGVIPGFGGTQRLARRIGLPRAKELIFTGRAILAEEAFRLGLVNRVCPAASLMATTLEAAQGIAQQAPLALADAKRALRRSEDLPLAEGLAFESQLFGGLFDTDDQDEGMKAFVEKRAPRFTGR